jgi:voltage-gated potassium channel
MITRKVLYDIVEDNTTRNGKYFDFFIQGLILLSLVSFSLETIPDISENIISFLYYLEVFTVSLFSLEYLIRIWVSKKPVSYVFSFFGIIDLLAILPFFLVGFLDLRFLRAFRILRIFRALKIVRYNKAMKRFGLAFMLVKEEIVLFFVCTVILIFITSAGIYYFENEAQPETFKSIFHSAWWSIVTLTTVGYGDIYPITLGGRIFTFFVLMIGVGLVTVPAGLVASALSKAREIEE